METTYRGSCVAAGTMITLGNGQKAPVESLVPGQKIMSFNHLTGTFETTQVAYLYKATGKVDVIHLVFSDGSYIDLMNVGHGLFDTTLKKYVLINAQTVANYVGHSFMKAEESQATMISYSVEQRDEERYDVVSTENINWIANDFLVVPDTWVNASNVFDFDQNAAYDEIRMREDIATYGLYEYEEWEDYLTREEFDEFNGPMFKIVVEKGLMTIEEIFSLIQDFKEGWIE